MPDDLVLVDTDVWGRAIFSSRIPDPRVASWRRMLLGKQPLVASQTEGEVRFGALAKQWGATRMTDLESHLARTPTGPVTTEVIQSFATDTQPAGVRATHSRTRSTWADAWIAATAHAHDLPRLSGDDIYRRDRWAPTVEE